MRKGDLQKALNIITRGLKTQPDEIAEITSESSGTAHTTRSHRLARSFARMHLLCAYLNMELKQVEAASHHFERFSILNPDNE